MEGTEGKWEGKRRARRAGHPPPTKNNFAGTAAEAGRGSRGARVARHWGRRGATWRRGGRASAGVALSVGMPRRRRRPRSGAPACRRPCGHCCYDDDDDGADGDCDEDDHGDQEKQCGYGDDDCDGDEADDRGGDERAPRAVTGHARAS
eukprot:gene13957-biopygen4458